MLMAAGINGRWGYHCFPEPVHFVIKNYKQNRKKSANDNHHIRIINHTLYFLFSDKLLSSNIIWF